MHTRIRKPLREKCAACSYSGARTADAFLEFLDAKLEEDRGFARVESLDKLASAFMTATDKTGDLAHANAIHAVAPCHVFPLDSSQSVHRGSQQLLSHSCAYGITAL